jgi:hypothetical protein
MCAQVGWLFSATSINKSILTRRSSGGHQAKRGKNLSPRNRNACHSVSTALLKSIAEIGTQSAMKSRRKTLHEFTWKTFHDINKGKN